MVILAHKIALNPTRSQERLLWEHVGYARFAANRAIEDWFEKDSLIGTTRRCAHAGTQARLNSLPGLPTSARTRPRTPYAMSARLYPGGESTGVL